MFFRILGSFLVALVLMAAKLPQLSPKDTRVKIEEILKAHVAYHELTPELITRAFHNYLDELDPNKVYFLKEEILQWAEPSQSLLEETLSNIKKENFSNFEALHENIVKAIDRRNTLEESLSQIELPKKVQPSQFKNLDWGEIDQELLHRIASIRSLQLDAAEKFDGDIRSEFMQLLEKRRLKHEKNLIGDTPKDRQKLVLSYVLKSVSSALDSQTAYFTPAEANQFMTQVQQRLFGIGALLRDDLNGLTIVRILDGSPAKDGNKIRVNDKIIAVNKEPIVGMDLVEAVELIRGPKGTSVNLTILREVGEETEKHEEKVEIKITRGEIVLTESRMDKSYEPFGDGVIGILHLHSFYQDDHSSSTSDLKDAITELKKAHRLKGIVLDLRNNAGGLLPQAVTVTGLFIKKGIVVSVKDNTGQVQHLRNIDNEITWDGPLAVLTNKGSASAAEIVAQTLKDYNRALLIGDETTYGKGTFQTFTLESVNYGKVNPKGEFKVTRGCYYTVSGKSPQLVGVVPHFVVPGIYSYVEFGEKYSKYPLANEEIPPNFNDDLSDVPQAYRNQISRLYKFNLQPILTTYDPYMDILKKNSEKRIEQNKNYQNFIKEISNPDTLSETHHNYGLNDLQLDETMNILKDLILLLEKDTQIEEFTAA